MNTAAKFFYQHIFVLPVMGSEGKGISLNILFMNPSPDEFPLNGMRFKPGYGGDHIHHLYHNQFFSIDQFRP